MASKKDCVDTKEVVAGTSQENAGLKIDWKLCMFCQEITHELLQCPALSKRKDLGAGYKYVAENIVQFNDLHALPFSLNVDKLQKDDITHILVANDASWHKTCRNKISNLRLENLRKRKSECEVGSPVKTRRSWGSDASNYDQNTCVFCDSNGWSDTLHKVSTLDLDFKVRKHAADIGDRKLLSKLTGGDMVAKGAHYHNKCLSRFYRIAENVKSYGESDTSTQEQAKSLHAIALAELVEYLETNRADEGEHITVFNMSDLGKKYASILERLGVPTVQIHTTRLKDRIIGAIPDIKAYKKGREIMLAFDEDVNNVLTTISREGYDSDALHIMNAANIIRKDILSQNESFDGTFGIVCQENAIPSSLLTLVNAILYGPKIQEDLNANKRNRTADLSLSQLMIFNTVNKINKKSEIKGLRHTKERETPLPIYVALKIHAETRKRTMVDTFHKLGLCISYNRMLEISTNIANTVCEQYENDDAVVPPRLRKQLFTTAAVDNIDHNPSSTTSKDSFHGTGISLMQHPSVNKQGVERNIPVINTAPDSPKTILQLPESYTVVLPSALKDNDPLVPIIEGLKAESIIGKQPDLTSGRSWLEHVLDIYKKKSLSENDVVSWSAYCAVKSSLLRQSPTVIELLPLFHETTNSVAMVKHTMNVVFTAVQYLNRDQVPVIVMDQPIYAIAKKIQWNCPETYGEHKLLVMFGGLHIEMNALKLLGDMLEGSGWTNAIVIAGIASSGTADSCVKATHVTRTRRIHQITAAALSILQRNAYEKYISNSELPEPLDFQTWCAKMSDKQPQFLYWALILELELILLKFVGSIRDGCFEKYIEALSELLPWSFALDHVNYSRWLSVHLRDMANLHQTHPSLYQEFCSGHFVARRSSRSFSAIALDQAHEQMNALIKGDGGAVGLLDNPSALRRWMIAGPEISRILSDFENIDHTSDPNAHHEQRTGFQKTFLQEIRDMTNALEEMGNPFTENSGELMTIDNKEIMSTDIVNTLKKMRHLGTEQCKLFINERFEDNKKTIQDPLPKNKLAIFSRQKPSNQKKTQMAVLKEDCNLFSRLYIACQSRDGDLGQFFKQENQPWPPSISKLGEMRSGTKSDLLQCLEELVSCVGEDVPKATAQIFDGAFIAQMIKPMDSTTFQDYIDNRFMPYIYRENQNIQRIDIVWDRYLVNSLKAATREKRGHGTRRKVLLSSKVPSNWQSFLRVDENKEELFSLLSEQVVAAFTSGNRDVYCTHGERVMCSRRDQVIDGLEPCTHEEADTRIMVHLLDTVKTGHNNIIIRTADTDVVVIVVSFLNDLQLPKVWIAFGVGKKFKYIPAHEIAKSLGPTKSVALRMFHAITGCDVVSFFYGRGKKRAWDTWSVFPEVTFPFHSLSTSPSRVDEKAMEVIERFVVLIYDRMSPIATVNEAREFLFSRRSRTLQDIPPTQAALQQHVLRASFQAGQVWDQALEKEAILPSPGQWGWKCDTGKWEPVWTLLPQVQFSCSELIRCGCLKECRGRCKCYKASLKCTALCTCGGDCDFE